MTGKVKAAPAHAVRCPCGRPARVEASSFGRPRACPACGATFKAVWAVDPKTGRRVAVTVPQGELSSDTPPAFRIPAGAQEVVCDCGQHLVVRPRNVGKAAHCPVCRRSIRLERYKDPQTLETRVRRVDAGGRRARTRKVPAVTAADLAAAAARPATQELLCACGEYLPVGAEHLGTRVQCGACGAVMKVEKGRDPETGASILRAVLVGKAAGGDPGDSDAWSLDDFR